MATLNTLPHDIVAEQACLGSMLIEPQAIEACRASLLPEDFYRTGHQVLCRAIYQLYDRKVDVDFVTLPGELRTHSLFEAVGGMAYLASLFDTVPGAYNIAYYRDIVLDKAARRRLVSVADEIATLARNEATEDVQAKAESLVYALRRTHGRGALLLQDALYAFWDEAEAASKAPRALMGCASLLASLDGVTDGFKAGEQTVFAARTSIGKTAIMLTIASAFARQGLPVIVFSLEMASRVLAQRVCAMLSGTPSRRGQKGYFSDEDWISVGYALQIASAMPLVIVDDCYTEEAMRAAIRRFAREQGRVGAVVVDYLQIMRSTHRIDSREREVSAFSAATKGFAMEFECPVLTASQLRRSPQAGGKDPEPSLYDLRESGDIENNADMVIFLHRQRYDGVPDARPDTEETDVIVAKNRNGMTGRCKLGYKPRTTHFVEAPK